jgi:Nucleosome assembly protein (NAP)
MFFVSWQVRRRIRYLEELQNKYDELDEQFEDEMRELEKKYRALYGEVFQCAMLREWHIQLCLPLGHSASKSRTRWRAAVGECSAARCHQQMCSRASMCSWRQRLRMMAAGSLDGW